MSKEKELVVVEPKSVLTAFSSKNGLSEVIDSAVMEVRTFKHDMTTKAGRDKTRSLARKVASLKTTLDGMGKDLVAEWKTKSKAVDANRKKMRDDLDELKVEARKPLTEFEAIEQARKDEKLAVISLMESLALQLDGDSIPYTLDQLKGNLESLGNIIVDDSFEEYELSATKQKAKSIATLEALISGEEKRIEEAAELERLRAAEEARAQKERDEAMRKEAADKARLEAEAIAKEAAEKVERERDQAIKEKAAAEEATKQAERDKIAAEENAKLEAKVAAERAKQIEIKRQEDEAKAAQAAQEKKEANKAHVGKIRGAAKTSLMAFVDEETAKKIVLAIHAGEIKNIKITY
jgi:hypothetical protein